MTTLQDLQQTISRFVKGGRKRRQLKRELAQLAAMGELDGVLADVGLVRSQVGPLIAGSGDAHDRLDKMLDRLGIEVAHPPVESLREMAVDVHELPRQTPLPPMVIRQQGAGLSQLLSECRGTRRCLVEAAPGTGFLSAPGPTHGHLLFECRRTAADADRSPSS